MAQRDDNGNHRECDTTTCQTRLPLGDERASMGAPPTRAPFDPVARTEELERIVTRGDARKYYRFRPARFYGGIVTGDVVGCNLLCGFCWASDRVRDDPGRVGEFYTPERAYDTLRAIGDRRGYRQVRLSGQEPTVGWDHLLGLLARFAETDYRFILETNGIVIGAHPARARTLAQFRALHVRVSLKGATPAMFATLTGAAPDAFSLQLAALGALVDAGVSCHPAVMASFANARALDQLFRRLRDIHPALAASVEREELVLYKHTKRRLKRLGFDSRRLEEK